MTLNLLLTCCGCGLHQLQRIPRRWWMRLVTNRRLYRCAACGKQQLGSEREINEAIWDHRREQLQRWHESEDAASKDVP